MRLLSPLRLVAALLLGCMPVAVLAQLAVTVDGNPLVLRDVQPDAWYSTYVRDAVASGIVSGYRDAAGQPIKLFGPADSVTLAQTLKIVVGGAGYDAATASGTIPATLSGHWAAPYLKLATRNRFTVFELMQNIDRPATRAEVASLFTDAFRVDTVTPVGNRYSDVGASTPYAYSIEALSRDRILNGDTDALGRVIGRFRPDDPINRAEVTKMVMIARSVYGTPARSSSSSVSSASSHASSGSGATSSSVATSSSSASSQSSRVSTVTLTDAGFTPSRLHVSSGTTVLFLNNSATPMRVISDPHPGHTDHPSLDAGRSFGRGETFSFPFTSSGTWGYHNENQPALSGAVLVQ